ncbi:hypothetical protein [Marinobacterium iners]|nr:hypothetical protein [Marinobacterium iners]
MRVFIIDDDPFIRHLMSHQSCEVHEFDGGVGAMPPVEEPEHDHTQ